MPELYRAIIKPLVTEKSSALYESRKIYTFRVATEATKPEIRDAIEHLFGVTVRDVHTMGMVVEMATVVLLCSLIRTRF